MIDKQTLSDFNLDVDGMTADDIIEGRRAKTRIIRKAAQNGNVIAKKAVGMDSLFESVMGYHPDYSEEYTSEDEDCGMY